MDQPEQPVPNLNESSARSTDQAHLTFHLMGKRLSDELESIDVFGLLPALLAGYRDLANLRYDFPVVLVRNGRGEAEGIESLSGLFDAALRQSSDDGANERLKRQALRLELEIRCLAADRDGELLSDLWDTAISRLSAQVDGLLQDNLRQLRTVVAVDGVVTDCNTAMPLRLCRHVWEAVQQAKVRRLGERIADLVTQLSNILQADAARSAAGRTAESLAASVGVTHQHAIDFEELSRLLADISPPTSLSESRRKRIKWLRSTLTSQPFYPSSEENRAGSADLSGFVFTSCAEAIAAYHERLPQLTELGKALAIAEREVEGEYDEAKHDAIFASLDFDSLDQEVTDLFPDYLIAVRASDVQAEDNNQILDALAADLRVKILFQIDDLLGPSLIAGRELAFDRRRTQLASMAMGLNTPYVLQASSSHLFQLCEQVHDGMAHSGSALFSVFSGASTPSQQLPPYLVAAAASESRAFPSFMYDPSGGSDWASRFQLRGNPQPDLGWPVQNLSYQDEELQRESETLAFTFVDFVACDPRHAKHFARVPRSAWTSHMVRLSEFLAQTPGEPNDSVPFLYLIDRGNSLHKVIVDDKMVREARHCADAWQNLRNLGNFHSAQSTQPLVEAGEPSTEQSPQPPATEPVQPTATEAALALALEEQEIAAESEEPQLAPGEPYIETARCTTCNECTQINDKMFAYNENKQAFIRDPDAGTYRQMVEAAESCQVAIIHPGKPRNPDEEGLNELMTRAQSFQ